MSSEYRLYLTSNEQNDIYTHNTPSHFETHFENPIEVQDSWKVALENISYSSHLKSREATIHVHAIPTKEKARWTKHAFHYRLDKNECWLGHDGVELQDPIPKHDTIESLLETLNGHNNRILTNGTKKKLFGHVFRFSFDKERQRVTYQCFDPGFTMRISTVLSQVLGFGYRSMFVGDKTRVANEPYRAHDISNLDASDFDMPYFNEALQYCERRIQIKEKGVRVSNATHFLTLWKQTVCAYVDFEAKFKSGKLVVNSHKRDTYFTCSPDFQKTFAFYRVFLANTVHGKGYVSFDEDNTNEEWFIDLYSSRMAFDSDVPKIHKTFQCYPWQCKTYGEAMRRITCQLNHFLKDALKEDYNERQHDFRLITNSKGHIIIHLGPRLEITLSDNLRCLWGLAITHERLNNNKTCSDEKVGKFFEHSEDLTFTCSLFDNGFLRFTHVRTDESYTHIHFKKPYFWPMPRTNTSAVCELKDSKGNLLNINECPTFITLLCRKDSQ